jgi:hypothetical protein
VLILKIGDFIDFWNFNEKILTLIPKIKDFITSKKKTLISLKTTLEKNKF